MNDKKVVYYQNTWNGVELTFTFDQRVIDVIKRRVKANNRSYNRASRAWVIYHRSDFDNLRDATSGWIEWSAT